MLAALDADPREDARERQDPRRQARRAGSRAPASERFHDGNSTGSAGGGVAGRAPARRALRSCADVARAGERAFVDARLERVLERHHQLDAFERAQPELLERRRRRRRRRARRTSRPARPAIVGAGRTARRAAAALHPVANRRALQLARALGARQLALGPDERAADPLVIARAARSPRGRPRRRSTPGLEHQHGVHALLAVRSRTPTTADSRTPGSSFSTRSTSSGKTFSPSGVTIISFLRPRMKSWPSAPISPMSPVWNQPSSNARAVSSAALK